jgi:hypothetical protein
MSHYNVYREACIAAGVDMNERAMPKEEIERLSEKPDLDVPDRYVIENCKSYESRLTDCSARSRY